MKKNCTGVSYKGYLLPALIILLIIGSIVSYSYGEEEKEQERRAKWGFSVFGGIGDAIHSKTDLEIYGVIPHVTLPLHKKWKYWDIEFEGNFFYYNIHKMHDFYFLGLSNNIVFKPIQKKWGSLFLLIGGGLGYDSAGKRLRRGDSDAPLMGDQHFAGFCHGGLGILYNVGRGKALRLEYRFSHISEPFDTSDRGLNTHNILFGVSFW